MKGLRERAIARAGSVARSLLRIESEPACPGVPVGELIPILYPGDDQIAWLTDAARSALGGRDRVESVADLRVVLGSFDRMWHPSPVRVRLPVEQVRWQEEGTLRIPIDPADPSVGQLIATGTYEPHVTSFIQRTCLPGWTVMDVGANVGYHSLRMAALVGCEGTVIAVEANPDNCLLIQLGAQANEFNNIRLLPFGMSTRIGWSYFTTHLGTNGGLLSDSEPRNRIETGTIVPLMSVDDLLDSESRLDLMKVDVEGAEGLVTAGAAKTIDRLRPIVISEFSCEMLTRVSDVPPLEYLRFFSKLGYGINKLDKESPGEVVGYRSAEQLLDAWPDELHIEDLVFLPS